MAMKAAGKSVGKVSAATAVKTAEKMDRMVKEGSDFEMMTVFLFSLILAVIKDALDWIINLLDLTGVGAVIVIAICFILSLTIGLTITIFMMLASPHGMIRKFIMKWIAKYLAFPGLFFFTR